MIVNYNPQMQTGVRLDRPAAQLPQNTTGDIFYVTGGTIVIADMIGTVTTQMDAVATTVKARFYEPAHGNTYDLCVYSASISGAPVGTHLYITVSYVAMGTDIATRSGWCDGWPSTANRPYMNVKPAGTIRIQTTGSNVGGAVAWSLWYIPLDDSVSVAAA